VKLFNFLVESNELDFKETVELDKPKSWLKSVSAFANSLGGKIYFGVTDQDHEIIGLEDTQTKIDKITELIKDRISPLPKFEIKVIPINGKEIIELEVESGSNTPYYYFYKGSRACYIRIGSSSNIAPDYIWHELIAKGIGTTYDAQVSNYKLEDFSFTLLKATYKREVRKDFLDKYFTSFGLVDEKTGNLTYAGLLLADESPLRHSKLVCTRWSGVNRAGGVIDAIMDREYQGDILWLLKRGLDFIETHNRVAWKKLPRKRKTFPDYEERATTEVLVNALIHRNYYEYGANIHIDIFDDRMEIYSPGGMFNNRFIQDLDLDNIPSKRRNPVIAAMFARLEFMEGRGSGFEKIFESLENRDDIEFYSDTDNFRVTIKNLNLDNELLIKVSAAPLSNTSGPLNDTINDTISDTINPSEEEVKLLIVNNPHITKTELSNQLNKSTATISRILKSLKDKGLIERVGAKKTGYWKILK